jgi:hypothetical protein
MARKVRGKWSSTNSATCRAQRIREAATMARFLSCRPAQMEFGRRRSFTASLRVEEMEPSRSTAAWCWMGPEICTAQPPLVDLQTRA